MGKYTKQHNKNKLNRNQLTESQTTLILNGKGYAFVRALQILNTPFTEYTFNTHFYRQNTQIRSFL